MQHFLTLLSSIVFISSAHSYASTATNADIGSEAQKVEKILDLLEQTTSIIESRFLTVQENEFLINKLGKFDFEPPDKAFGATLELPIERYNSQGSIDIPKKYAYARVEISIWLIIYSTITGDKYYWASPQDDVSVDSSFIKRGPVNYQPDGWVVQYDPNETDQEIANQTPSFDFVPFLNWGGEKLAYWIWDQDEPNNGELFIGKVKFKALRKSFVKAMNTVDKLNHEAESNLVSERENIFLYKERIENLIVAYRKYLSLLK